MNKTNYKNLIGVMSLSALTAFGATSMKKNTNYIKADNSAVNKRDADQTTMLPEDQGSASKSDVETTRLIRKAIVGTQGLSTNAKNIKIVTTNGEVTLRGPVNSMTEKNTIMGIVQSQVAGETRVKNELEIQK